MNWRKWNAEKGKRSARAQHASEIRWARYHAALSAEPVRASRVVEITIRDTHRPMRVICLRSEVYGLRSDPCSRSRWAVTENGTQIGTRRLGTTAIARAIARSLQ